MFAAESSSKLARDDLHDTSRPLDNRDGRARAHAPCERACVIAMHSAVAAVAAAAVAKLHCFALRLCGIVQRARARGRNTQQPLASQISHLISLTNSRFRLILLAILVTYFALF